MDFENSEEKLKRILAHKAEVKNVDFKLKFNWNKATKEEKGKIVKDIIAMANSKDGGIIIFGIRNEDMEPLGISKIDYESFDQTKISDFINNYTYPKVSFVVEKPVYNGNFFVMITINEFDKIPIICIDSIKLSNKRDIIKKGCICVRTEKASSQWIGSAEEWKELIELVINKEKNSKNQRMQEITDANSFIDDNMTNMFKSLGRWEIVVYPKHYMKRVISEIEQLRNLINKFTSKFYYGFPVYLSSELFDLNNGVGSYYPLKRQEYNEFASGFEMTLSGILALKQIFLEDFKFNENPEQHTVRLKILDEIILTITNLFLFCKNFYSELNLLDYELILEISLIGAKERKLTFNYEPYNLTTNFLAREDIKVYKEVRLSNIASSYKQEAKKIIIEIVSKFQCRIDDKEIDPLQTSFPE